MLMKIFILISLMKMSLAISNLIQGGDFEYYDGTFSAGYAMLPSNISKWYNSNLGQVQLKYKLNPITTVGTELSTTMPITVCQDITLNQGHQYRLSFSLFCERRLNKMIGKAYLNGQIVSQLYISSNGTFGTKYDYFIAPFQQNTICFNQSHSVVDPQVYGTLLSNGGLLDNVTLFQVEDISVKFNLLIDQLNSSIVFQSNYFNENQFVQQFKKRYRLEKFRKQFSAQYIQAEQGTLQIKIHPNETFCLLQLSFSQDKTNLTGIINFEILTHSQSKYFYFLTIGKQLQISKVSEIIFQITSVVGKMVLFFKSCFWSYFILSLIGFHNLTLYYIFLGIEVIPQFSKSAYYQMMKIFLEEISVVSWMNREFSIKKNFFEINQETIKVPEGVKDTRNSLTWFGEFGLSSLVWKNNYESFLLLIFLAMKIGLLKLVAKFIDIKTLGIKLDIGNIIFIFILQFLSSMPTLMISAVHQILDSSCNFVNSIEKLIQILLTFFCLWFIFLYRLKIEKTLYFSHKKCHQKLIKQGQIPNQNKVQQTKKSHFIPSFKQPQRKQTKTKAIKIKKYNSISNKVLTFSCTFLIVIKNHELFLIGVGLLIIFKTVEQQVCAQSEGNIKRIAVALINLTWICHHCVFGSFYIINSIISRDSSLLNKYESFIVFLGMFAILTVIIGTVLQVIKVFLNILEIIFHLIRIALKWKRKQMKILPEGMTVRPQYFNSGKKQLVNKKVGKLQNFNLKRKEKSLSQKTESIQYLERSLDKKKIFKAGGDRIVWFGRKKKINQ